MATYPQRQGCHIVPVPPKADSVLGETACPDVESVPESVDVANIFRPPHECPTCAEQAAAIGADALWLQLGIVSPEAAAIADEHGPDVVMNRCMKMEHGRYQGGMHWMGMNTGVITARRGRRQV